MHILGGLQWLNIHGRNRENWSSGPKVKINKHKHTPSRKTAFESIEEAWIKRLSKSSDP
jgi:hypothetical protein